MSQCDYRPPTFKSEIWILNLLKSTNLSLYVMKTVNMDDKIAHNFRLEGKKLKSLNWKSNSILTSMLTVFITWRPKFTYLNRIQRSPSFPSFFIQYSRLWTTTKFLIKYNKISSLKFECVSCQGWVSTLGNGKNSSLL